MRRLAFVALLLIVAACGSVGPRSGLATPQSSPSPSGPSAVSPARTVPAPTLPPSPSPPPVRLDTTLPLLANFSCQMPAQVWVGASVALPGFVDLRNGHFVSDPAAAPVVQNEHAATESNVSVSYSWAAHRWLPVGYEAVAPDGMHYAYFEATSYTEGRVHVVDIALGTDRVLLSGATWGNIHYAADGIYVEKIAYGSEGNWGLWLLNPTSGALKQLLPESVRDFSFGSGAAWVPQENPYQAKTVYRIDLSTGEQTLWFSKPNPFLAYVGADPSGRPLVGWEQSPPAMSELWVLIGPSNGTLLYSGLESTLPWVPALTDSHGTWFPAATTSGVLWLLTGEGKLIKVASSSVLPLGPCQ